MVRKTLIEITLPMFAIIAAFFVAIFTWFILPLLRDALAVLKDMRETLKHTKERPGKVAATREVLEKLIANAEKAKVPLANIRGRIDVVLTKMQLSHESCVAVKEFFTLLKEKITLMEQLAHNFMETANKEIRYKVEETKLTVPDLSLSSFDTRCVKVIEELLMSYPDAEPRTVERMHAILEAYP